MKYIFAFVVGLVANNAFAQDANLFQRNHDALNRAQQRNFEPPSPNGRTGYVERHYHNNTGNDVQSHQLDQMDRNGE